MVDILVMHNTCKLDKQQNLRP